MNMAVTVGEFQMETTSESVANILLLTKPRWFDFFFFFGSCVLALTSSDEHLLQYSVLLIVLC